MKRTMGAVFGRSLAKWTLIIAVCAVPATQAHLPASLQLLICQDLQNQIQAARAAVQEAETEYVINECYSDPDSILCQRLGAQFEAASAIYTALTEQFNAAGCPN